MRIVVDVSPLSHPRTGIGNYIRGSLAGMAEAASRAARARRVRADEPPRPCPHPSRARRDHGLAPAPAGSRLACAAHRLEPCRPPGRRAARRRARRVPLQRVDVPRAAGRGPRDRLSRPDPAAASRVVHLEDDLDAHAEGPECGARPATSSSPTPTRPRPISSRCSGSSRTASCMRRPASRPASGRSGRAAELGGPSILGLGTIEPRKNLARLVEAWRLLDGELGLVLAGGEGWGDRPDLADPRILRLGYVPDVEIARLYRGASVLVYPVALRGLRDAGRRGDGVRHARGRVRAPVARRGVRGRGGARRSARPRGDRGRDPRGACTAGGARDTRPRPRGAVLLAAGQARRSSPRSRSAREREPPSGRGRDRRAAARRARPGVPRAAPLAREARVLAPRRRRRRLGRGPREGRSARARGGDRPRRGPAGRSAARSPTTSRATPSRCAPASPPGRSGSRSGRSSQTRRPGGSRSSTTSTWPRGGSTATTRRRSSATRSPARRVRRAAMA